MRRYVGVTIGPIFDTIMDASSPAALWFASSLFSDMTRRICSEIKNTFKDAIIYSPYFGSDIQLDDGIGKFHDRIMFSTEQYDSGELQKLVLKVKRDTAIYFPEKFVNSNALLFFEQYIQIHYMVLEEKELESQNCILELSPYLDALELMRSFPEDNANNAIRRLFCGEEAGGNIYIKSSPLFKRIEEECNQLKKDKDGLWKIEEIACDHGKIKEKLKRKDYYAVVQADGDNVGKFLETLNHQIVKDFSKACLDYDRLVSEEVGLFGGMTIYAGGDDLLFLAPVINADGKSIFELCKEIGRIFQETITAVDSLKFSPCIPTISFGIAVQHKKYPLYEAFARGRDLLDAAKKNMTQKNSMAIEVLKHSGKSIKIIVPNKEYAVFQKVLELGNEKEKTVHSVIYTLQKFEKLIFILNHKIKKHEIDKEVYRYAFKNLFDNEEQAFAVGYLEMICNTYRDDFVLNKTEICILSDKGIHSIGEEDESDEKAIDGQAALIEVDESLKAYLYLLQIKKFLLEKEGRES